MTTNNQTSINTCLAYTTQPIKNPTALPTARTDPNPANSITGFVCKEERNLVSSAGAAMTDVNRTSLLDPGQVPVSAYESS